MASPLDKTFRYLSSTENLAAVQIIQVAMSSTINAIRQRALQAVVKRNHPGLVRGAFLTFASDEGAFDTFLADGPEAAAKLAGQVVKTQDKNIGRRACKLIADHRLYESLPSLVTRAQQPRDPLGVLAAETCLQLAESFHEEMVEAGSSSARADLDRKRDWLMAQLEPPVRSFPEHERIEPLEAFLVVTKRDNNTLLKILDDHKSVSHAAIVDILEKSERGGVIRLLLSFVTHQQAPPVVDRIVAHRTDLRFVENLLRTVGETPKRETLEHLARYEDLAWARPGHRIFSELSPDLEPHALSFVRHAGVGRETLMQMIEYYFQHASDEGRRRAANILNYYQGADADRIACNALGDEDAEVRATLIRGLRKRQVPDAMSLLTRMATESHEREVCDALRDALPEFSLQGFLTRFEQMPDALASKLALIVRNIDVDAPRTLTEEMYSISPVRRRRAIQVAALMNNTTVLESQIVRLTRDEDHRVRITACEVLAKVSSRASFEALRAALADRSVAVQRVARQSLAEIYRRLTTRSTQPLASS